MKVNVLRYPTQEDWNRAKLLALGTEGKEAKTPATAEWKDKLLRCEHSPIRTLMFTIQLVDVPYWVSVHLVRHKFGIEHYVKSQRNDRQSEYDRNSAPQNAPVNHIIDVNAQELMFMARKRLCSKAAAETKQAMEMIVEAVVQVCPEFGPHLVPQCVYLGRCPEMYGCGMFADNQPLGINEYQRKAMRTASMTEYDKLPKWAKVLVDAGVITDNDLLLLNGAMGLNGEAGEFIDLVKKHLFQGKPLDKEHLAKELGDVAWYLAVAAQGLGYNLETILQMNVDKLMERYPNGFEVQRSEHRKEGDI